MVLVTQGKKDDLAIVPWKEEPIFVFLHQMGLDVNISNNKTDIASFTVKLNTNLLTSFASAAITSNHVARSDLFLLAIRGSS